MIRLFFICTCLVCGFPVCGQQVLIQDIHLIHVGSGQVSELMDILVQGDSIQAIRPAGSKIEEGVISIDGNGGYVIPGLWDMHTHNAMGPRQFFPLLLANGVTGIRSMFDPIDSVNAWKSRIASGVLQGPEIYTSGPIVDGPRPMWPGSVSLSDPEQVPATIDSLQALGVDFVKVYSFMNRETYFSIAQYCRQQSITFAGHIPNVVSIWEAAEAGQKSSEHGYGLLIEMNKQAEYLRAIYRKEQVDSSLSTYPQQRQYLAAHFAPEKAKLVADSLANTGMYICPTLVVNRSIASLSDSAFRADPRNRYMNPFLVMRWQPQHDFRLRNLGPEYYETEQLLVSHLTGMMGTLEKAGVKLLAGTDYMNPFIYPGFSLHDELALMVEGGMTNRGALATATINPAAFLNAEKYGDLAPGKIASFVILSENPLDHIEATESITYVSQRGNIFSAEELQAALEKLARQYGQELKFD